MQKVLVTDTLFIFPEHEDRLRKVGYQVVRVPETRLTEKQLIKHVKGKVGHILGGVEIFTEPVIRAADKLRCISFAGTGAQHFVPAHESAAKKHIAVTNAPGANSAAVAEYTITLILVMLRGVLELTRIGKTGFKTMRGLSDVEIGVIGIGQVGEKVARMLVSVGATNVSYYSRTRKPELETELGITYKPLQQLYASADVVTSHVSHEAGMLFNKRLLETTKPGVIFINTGSITAYDYDALYDRLLNHGAKAAFDDAELADSKFTKLPLDVWLCSNETAAYNTYAANRIASDMVVDSIINILSGKPDNYVVNGVDSLNGTGSAG